MRSLSAIFISAMNHSVARRPTGSPGTKLGGWRPTSPSCRSYCGGRPNPSKSPRHRAAMQRHLRFRGRIGHHKLAPSRPLLTLMRRRPAATLWTNLEHFPPPAETGYGVVLNQSFRTKVRAANSPGLPPTGPTLQKAHCSCPPEIVDV